MAWGLAACRRSWRSSEGSKQFAHGCAGDEREFARFRNRRTVSQDGVILLFDGVENLEASTAEQIEIDGQFTIDLGNQRKALTEPVAGALDFEFHQLAKRRSVPLLRDVVFADLEKAQVFKGQIDPTLFVIDADILPEVGEL